MSKKKGAGPSKTDAPTEKKQLSLFDVPTDTIPKEKVQTRFDKLIACRCAVLSFDDAERYLELEQRYSRGGGGITYKEQREYYELRELATARLLAQRRKYNG